jgi:hypothetical protein
MSGTAAHLTDRVFPDVPVRQWVLSVPFELRLLLARDHRALSAVGRIFVREVFRAQRERARALGIAKSHSAAVCFPQRFGGSLNLNVHYHVAVADGVFTLEPHAPRAAFHPLPPPDAIDIATIAQSVELRVLAWLRHQGLLSERDDDADDGPPRSALDACLSGSLGLGELAALFGREQSDDLEVLAPAKRERRLGRSRGFDVNASVRVAAHDREGRERLLRYCARAPLSLERLSRLPDGRVAYALRKPWGKQTHRVMQSLELLARLAALVPPPRHPLIRFHGVLAPHSSWRKRVVPVGVEQTIAARCTVEQVRKSRPPRRRAGPAVNVALPPPPEPALDLSSRIPWAELLKRVYDVDALACRCGGRLRFIALILDERVAEEILENLDLPSRPPPVARARSPDLRDE